MPHGMMHIQLKNVAKLKKDIYALEKRSENVVKNTTSDFKSRAPAWISAAVTETYNIKKSEVKDALTGKKAVGKIRLSGKEIDNVQLVYEGRQLTPVHFGMTPKIPGKGRSYTLKQTVYKGKTKIIGRYLNTRTPDGPYSKKSHNILMPTGTADTAKISHIPFQRMSRNRKDIKKFTSTSIPQMITNQQVSKKIQKNISEGLGKRLEHHLNRELKK